MKLKNISILLFTLLIIAAGIISLLFPPSTRAIYSSPVISNNTLMAKNLSQNDFISNRIIKIKGKSTKNSTGILAAATSVPSASSSGKSTLILYDSTGNYGWIGALYSVQLTNMISHFDVSTVRKPVESYQKNDYQNYDSVIYYGALYDTPLPQAFKDDLLITTKPFMWLGYNLWKVAVSSDWSSYNSAFETKFGIRYRGTDTSGYPNINFKGYKLGKLQYDPTLTVVDILDSSIATVLATAENATGATVPYAVKANNLWTIADNPFIYAYMADRSWVLADILHDFFDIPHPTTVHKAFVRIEDVHPDTPPSYLKAIADYLYAEKVPFGICLIPEFRDPIGDYYDGVPTTIKVEGNTAFIKAINYCLNKGGKLIHHGYTHQYSNVKNPYNGVTGDDFEFYKLSLDAAGIQVFDGPVPEDSTAWAYDRIKTSQQILTKQGWNCIAWNTPHYIASSDDYKAFLKLYKVSVDRGLSFATGTDGSTYLLQQVLPYVTQKDQFGFFRTPENLGYIDTLGGPYQGIQLPADLIERARKNLCVRDSMSGFYFHWFVDISYLKTTVAGIKALGYKFVQTNITN